MAVYGVDFYLRSKYGSTGVVTYSVAPFQYAQSAVGSVHLSWSNPVALPLGSTVRLVRNPDGYASTERDGQILLNQVNGTDSMAAYYDDSGLVAGRFYYYTIFVGVSFPTWISGQTYNPGDSVTYNGVTYTAQSYTTITPGTNGAVWQPQSSSFINWFPAGALSCLVVAEHGYTDRFYDLIPTPYKVINEEVTDQDAGIAPTPDLYKFTDIFGFTLNTMATEYNALLDLNNPSRVSDTNAYLLAQEFGARLEPSASPSSRRSRLASQSAVARERGTAQGLVGLINTALGWDADVSIGPNMMLNADQSDFNNPTFEAWDPSKNYPSGYTVTYQGYVYTATAAGAYGPTQAPSGVNSSNTWWTWTTQVSTTALVNPTTGGYSTWTPVSFTAGVTAALSWLSILNGLQNALNSVDYSSNAAFLTNGSASTASIGATAVSPVIAAAWSATTQYATNNYVTYGGSTYRAKMPSLNVVPTSSQFWTRSQTLLSPALDPLQPVRDGVPIPRNVVVWDEQTQYSVGMIVQYQNYFYTALVNSLDVAPSGRPNSNSTWQFNGINNDFYTLSFYALTQISNPVAATSRPVMSWYGASGGLVAQVSNPTNPSFFDFFDNVNPVTSHANAPLTAAYGVTAPSWTEYNGTWPTIYGEVYALGSAAGRTTLTTDPGRANYKIGVTLKTPNPGKEFGLAFRVNDGSNFYAFSKSGLFKYASGSKSAIIAPSVAINDGDRILLTVNGNQITVQKYGPINADGSPNLITVASTTDSTYSTYTRVGLFSEV